MTESTCLHLDQVCPTDLAYGSEVSVVVDEGAFLDMAGHETGLRFRHLPTKLCLLVYPDSARHNADAGTDEEGSDDEWLAKAKQKGTRVRSQHDAVVALDDLEKTEAIPISFMTWKSKASKRTILSTFGAEASAFRDALDLAEYIRAMICEVLIGGRILPDEWTEEHLPIRVITDCKSLFDGPKL